MRGPSAGERSTLEPYFREVGPLPTLTERDAIQRLRGLAEEGVLPDGILHDERNEFTSWDLTREPHGQAR